MITYKKKALKVCNIFGKDAGENIYYSHHIAGVLKDFIENSNYGRIVDVFIYGVANKSLVCSIIYEEIKKEEER